MPSRRSRDCAGCSYTGATTWRKTPPDCAWNAVSFLMSPCNALTCSRRNSRNSGSKKTDARPGGSCANGARRQKPAASGELQTMAVTLLRHAKGVLSYYKTGLTSGKMEGINRKIRGLLASAFSFRDQDFLKLRLYALP